EQDNVFSIQEILAGDATPGKRVLLLDDLNDWRGVGTGVLLAEKGHEVTVVTSAPLLAKGLGYSDTDGALRKRFAVAGGEGITDAALLSWDRGTARLRHLLTGREWTRTFDSLALATSPEADTTLERALVDSGLEVHTIGDCVAPRRASVAFYEGRKLALGL
ncbi:MAG: FAD-dependent oxidoreductase, partial [Gammaproteobacteria bacterium]